MICSLGADYCIGTTLKLNGKTMKIINKQLRHTWLVALLMFMWTNSAHSQSAGLLAGGAEELPALTLSVVKPLAEGPITLKSGKYYKLTIICDGSGELALGGSGFFRNIWVDEVVINDIEIRPFGIESMEFDDEGEAEIKFIAIRPGSYELRIPGSTGKTQGVTIVIEG